MISQRTIVAISMTASLAVHASVVFVLPRVLPERSVILLASRRSEGMGEKSVESPTPATLSEPPLPPAPVPEPPPPLPELPEFQPLEEVLQNEFIIGRKDGTGSGNEASEGGVHTSLLQGANQANLSRDQQGVSDKRPPQENQEHQERQEKQDRQELRRKQLIGLDIPPTADLKGMGSQSGIEEMLRGLPTYKQGIDGLSDHPDSKDQTPEIAQGKIDSKDQTPIDSEFETGGDEQKKEQKEQREQQRQLQAAQPSPQIPVGQNRPQAETDSDLFSEQIDVEVRSGKVAPRSGRQMKFASPKVNLAAIVDAAMLPRPLRLVLLIDVDETGTVRNVTISQSSGSPSVDRAYEQAIYASWFEPVTRDGKAIRHVSSFTLNQY